LENFWNIPLSFEIDVFGAARPYYYNLKSRPCPKIICISQASRKTAGIGCGRKMFRTKLKMVMDKFFGWRDEIVER
jgi:hypothetical protein